MDSFRKRFGRLLLLVYHCFDRIVSQGHLPRLTRPEHIVHFFGDVHGVYPITKEALAKRTQEYQQWVEAFARNHRIPIEWPDAEPLKPKKLKKEDSVRPSGARMERQGRSTRSPSRRNAARLRRRFDSAAVKSPVNISV
jgi:hypothetical protein